MTGFDFSLSAYTGNPQVSSFSIQLRGNLLAATSHELSPVFALYVVTLDEFGANPNATNKVELEFPLTFTYDGAKKVGCVNSRAVVIKGSGNVFYLQGVW